ncbi:MAG: hypothetical protein GX939_02775 [Clostridiaceae bacterium]|jgi:hypothetical protein|nr:hypothetical protein [Clostridiaceae bacterium]
MQLAEIILSDTGGADVMRRMRIQRGITYIHVCSSYAELFPFYVFQSNLPSLRFDFEGRTIMPDCISQAVWTLVFHYLDAPYSVSTDDQGDGRSALLGGIIVGKESEMLAHRLDLKQFARDDVSDEDLLNALIALRRRLLSYRLSLLSEDEDKGTLALARYEYEDCTSEIRILQEGAMPEMDIPSHIAELENTLEKLKRRARRLSEEQKTNKLLSIKSEYETLLSLRKELKDTEQRDGLYGARITNLGHDITVHELTDLNTMRARVRELEKVVAEFESSIESINIEKNQEERRRILSRREANDLAVERKSLLATLEDAYAEVSDTHQSSQYDSIDRRRNTIGGSVTSQGEDAFPTTRHLVVLGGLLLLAIGLLLLAANRTFGLVFAILGIVAAAIALLSPLLIKRFHRPGRLVRPFVKRDFQQERDRLQTIERTLEMKREEDAVLTKRIDELETAYAETTIQLEFTSSELSRVSRDLLMYVKPYAGPSQMEEIDDILETLMRQRHSNDHYNERVSDLLRRIGDLKHGRSDDEMEREYEKACHQLYGDMASGDHNAPPVMNINPTLELNYDPERARAVIEERSEVERQIAEIQKDIAEKKERFTRDEDLKLRLDGLKRKQTSLKASISSLNDDLLRYDSAIRFLDTLIYSRNDLRLPFVMRRTIEILGRLTGRMVGSPVPVADAALPHRGMRVPNMPVRRVREGIEDRMPEDISLFDEAPAELSYLAFRMALADAGVLTGSEMTTPLILLDPVIPVEPMYRDRLFDTLEEWTLETTRQLIYVSDSKDLADRASERHLTVYTC